MAFWSRDSFWWRVTRVLKDKAIERALKFKDTRYTALLVVEFILSMIIVASIVLWLDHRYNAVEFPFNILLFGLSLYAVLHFYNYTAIFRRQRAMKRATSFRIFLLEFLIFAIIAVGGYVYQDPAINTLPYPLNFTLFLVILIPVTFIYINEKFLKPVHGH